ncbi:hypothetical protein M9H77_17056 [Catharanthus roseus]|uniref:Uncharacterized protein n=1 Tax=Catharanthus roseus TaxID=4058 RepID=A0ACC0B3I5_CATRO|nr:hypothetical protein M9H77_17056 [Catharanthus roseus]
MKRVRELARVKELSESGKKFEMTKIEVGPIFCVKKHVVVKSRSMIVADCFSKESLTEIGLVELHVSARLLNSTHFAKEYYRTLVHEFYANLDEDISDVGSSFHDVVYVRKEVVDFNVEELSAFLGVPFIMILKGLVTKKTEADIRKAREVKLKQDSHGNPPMQKVYSCVNFQ